MMPEDVTAESIVSLDDDVLATAPEIAESGITEELYFSQQIVAEEAKNNGDG